MCSTEEKLALVSQSSGKITGGKYDCDSCWFCLICNGHNIAKANLGEFTIHDLDDNRFRLI